MKCDVACLSLECIVTPIATINAKVANMIAVQLLPVEVLSFVSMYNFLMSIFIVTPILLVVGLPHMYLVK